MKSEWYAVCYKADSFGRSICNMWYVNPDLTPVEEMKADGPSDGYWMVPGSYEEFE